MAVRDLLIEIGTEELPPKALLSLSEAFQNDMATRLQNSQLAFQDIQAFASPRRLALKIRKLNEQQADTEIERFGPALKAAYDAEGKPTKAAVGFASSCGVDISALQHKSDGKLEKLFYSSIQAGATTVKLIPDLLEQSLASLPVPKRMRWGSSREEFVRPVHWIVILFGDEVIPANLFGLHADRQTYGHRFHHPKALVLNSVADYPGILQEQGKVSASFSDRRALIEKLLVEEANKLKARVEIDSDLLDEVTALVEWPVILTGNFDSAYLNVPKEALISSLKKHQKCFHLLDTKGDLLPHFISVSNLESRDSLQVIKGNEKVIGPRLADAAFFFTQDKQHKLEAQLENLQRVIFQKDLGTVHDKIVRVEKLAAYIAQQLGAKPALCQRAALLCKCDLLSHMVGEFADLQGIMGSYYASHDGEPAEVAQAIREHYLPRFAGDDLPASLTGITLALADRLDTICGLFGIGQPPSGSKDPFALRRAALGILRILLEKSLPLNLLNTIQQALAAYPSLPEAEGLTQRVMDFIFERLRAYYAEQGIDTLSFQAVDAVRPELPLIFDHRIKAVSHFAGLKQAQSLAKANKRVANILAKLSSSPGSSVDPNLLTNEAEKALFHKLNETLSLTSPMLASGKFQDSLECMASLQEPLDHFFEAVMVNVDDAATRENRQALLNQVRNLFLQVADISYLQAS
jgi:glycyl-tRNA synthetase beta chain